MASKSQCVYGLRVVLYIAKNNNDGYVPIDEISSNLEISLHFLTKILQILTQNHIMESYRGPSGGINFAMPAKQIKIIDIIGDKMASGEQVNFEHLEQIVDFIKNFADKCHHGKEEDILFESMAKAGFLKETGPISVMLSEHETGRDLVKGLSEAVEQYKRGDLSAVPAIIWNARKYSGLLTQHIDKENNILYPMAETHLTREQLDRMSEEFEKFELEQMGKGKHEEFHTIIKNLSSVYLK